LVEKNSFIFYVGTLGSTRTINQAWMTPGSHPNSVKMMFRRRARPQPRRMPTASAGVSCWVFFFSREIEQCEKTGGRLRGKKTARMSKRIVASMAKQVASCDCACVCVCVCVLACSKVIAASIRSRLKGGTDVFAPTFALTSTLCLQ